ncbi:hypothetical protein GCM10023194_52280 [Planotetraspora phitsanulokensis]|uniref:Uncharacterized protein n=1 Tax=Planotetraspora phitsanulokensis TaxID=575192 RepID=A0A8J3U7L1_9ACTN|nr:hypothetical protein [Planotetraspora phitsanulokensis]GII39790.1 hypothetical protein Pph01_47930 [Planotetraspora phitsanulokensis]
MTHMTGSTTMDDTAVDLHRLGRPIPFRRLLHVEARKLADTRCGSIVASILLVLVLASIVGRGVVYGPDLHTLVDTAGIGYGTLLPALGIVSVTGESTHRTALTTFALEPRRRRVLAATYLVSSGTAVAASLFALLVAVPVTGVVASVGDVPATWEIAPAALAGWTGTNVLLVVAGLALGTLLMNAPAAIVIWLSAPVLWSAVSRLGAVGEAAAEWCDLNRTTAPLAAGEMSGDDAARLAVAVICWIVVPTTAGAARLIRKDVN